MAYIQAAAPMGLQTGRELSADNIIPERHIVIETLRNAAPRLGLSASVISTLDAMLSCLAPKRTHHTVFASNVTLTFRRNGISERTIRRHAATLQEVGLLTRNDSPNRKRYTKHNRSEGKALRFGFDLSPLFAHLQEISAMAADVLREREKIDYLRLKIRSAASQMLKSDPNNQDAIDTLRILRRKLSVQNCEDILASQPDNPIKAEAEGNKSDQATLLMADNDGQNVRHHHNSTKELTDNNKRTTNFEDSPQEQPITVKELLAACPQATQFALRKIETVADVIAHAKTIAPMIGIDAHSFKSAQERMGGLRASATVWGILEFHDKIKVVGAYFRAITLGRKSQTFSPEQLVRRLAQKQC